MSNSLNSSNPSQISQSSQTVPLLDLQQQYRALKPALDAALIRVAESQVCVLGPEVDALERSLAEYTGSRFALGVSSGTDALLMALMALDLRAGDEVIMPTFSFFATAGAVARLGGVPVFVDSEPVSFNIDPTKLERAITPRTRAIMPVHLFGQAAAMQEIMRVAAAHGIPVIEDAAQAIGTEIPLPASPSRASGENGENDKNGIVARKVGSIGLMGCFSFYPTKNLGAFGDGGLVTTNDEALYTKLKQIRNHGMEPRYYHKLVGGNFRLDALQGAVLNVKLPHLDAWHAARRRNAALYTEAFVAAGLATRNGSTRACLQAASAGAESVSGFVGCPNCWRESSERENATHSGREHGFDAANTILLPIAVYEQDAERCGAVNHHIYNQYTIRTPRRDELRAFLAQRGIGAEIYYPVPFHRQECFAEFNAQRGIRDADFPVANCLAAHALSLPIYPELREEQIHYVVEQIAAFFQHPAR
jgi:dTDP-4-amino-4,6-dideoxygalactose transaminase